MDFPTGVELHNGKIRISFNFRGIRCREVLRGWQITSGNLKKAGNLRAVIVNEIQLGQFNYAQRFPESRALKKFSSTKRVTTFKELCDIFLSSKMLEVSAASYANYESAATTLKEIIGGDTQLSDIQHIDVLRYRKELLTGKVVNKKIPCFNKQGRTPSTVNNIMKILCAILRLAQRDRIITHVPHENVKMLTVSKKAPDPLLFHEYHALIAAMPKPQNLMWIFAVHSGLRHGEICALSWDDVNLEKGEIYISRNITNKGLFVPPKTAAGERTITLLQPALAALKEQYLLTGSSEKTEIIFHHREHGRTEQQYVSFVFSPGNQSRVKSPYFARSSIGSSWKRATKRSGIRRRPPYQSRHTYACWLLSSGANPSFIASQMGHENAKMVYEVYSKWIAGMNVDQVVMLNDRLQTLLPPICPQD
ncbi:site-specific integrase [Enterobacter ludwigii]|uniref:site-specific integrase n=1 Tax=Enterobacter ludwigii TaxID=299767 RepID=UPI0006438EA1|nr:site-specific integrase [Enterobacter ludwigii]KLP36203.1 integrase [Enterobacter ludwigii]